MIQYETFLERKSQIGTRSGFDPIWIPDFLFDFQKSLVEWALIKGKAAIFADCGLGKTLMQLVWADNVVRHTNRPVLIITPLAVSHQTVTEGTKFGIDCYRSPDGKLKSSGIVVTNYEQLHHFSPVDFAGAVCDESSILKNFEGSTKAAITEFMRMMEYRLLCTATAAPNDYIELGTSSEALGELGYMDMLGMFFKNDQNSLHPNGNGRFTGGDGQRPKWRFKPHAERPFWRWMCSWARAVRKPSDLGFDDSNFILPELIVKSEVVKASRPMDGFLFPMPAVGLSEQRQERKHTLTERCEAVAAKVNTGQPAVVWCHLNPEGDLLAKLIKDGQQVSGRDSDEEKEEKFQAFATGELRVLITKPVIGAFGLNWQHCNHVTFFPSHSFEQYYQAVRRCWRFGQKRPVTIDIVTTEGESEVMINLQRKADAAENMFSMLVEEMGSELAVNRVRQYDHIPEVPSWL